MRNNEDTVNDNFRRIFDRIRDVVLLLLGMVIIVHEVMMQESGPNIVASGIGLLFCLGPATFAMLPSWLGGPRGPRE